MKVISCGCSFMSLDPLYPGSHFTEILAKNFNAELISLARPGASNFYIALQVDHAIKQKPDLIIVLFSNYDRIEVLKSDCVYDVNQGISSINQTILSNVISNFIDQQLIDTQRQHVLKNWFSEIYDFGLQFHRDLYMCYGIISKLEKSGIPFMFNYGGMKYYNADPLVVWKDYNLNLVEDANPWGQEDFTLGTSSGVYHTSFDTQQDIANKWINFAKNSRKIVQCNI